MVCYERVFHYYFIPFHKNRVATEHNRCDIGVAHDGKVGCNTVEYTTAFLYSDWLHGINDCISLARDGSLPSSSLAQRDIKPQVRVLLASKMICS